MNKMKYKQYLLRLAGFAALSIISLSGVISPAVSAVATDPGTSGGGSTSPSPAATKSVTCGDGTVVNMPTGGNAASVCGSHGAPKNTAAGQTQNAADCPDEGDCAKKTAFAFNCGSRGSTTTNVGLSCLFITVINFMSVAVGLAVVGGVTVGGIMYSTSGGSPGKTQQGVKIIVNSLIGLVLWLLLWAIVQFLIPGGVFTS